MKNTYSRRSFFFQYSAAAGIASQVWSPGTCRAAADKVHIACIGVGGKGESDMRENFGWKSHCGHLRRGRKPFGKGR